MLKVKKMEISKLEEFYFTNLFTILHMHSVFAVELFFAFKNFYFAIGISSIRLEIQEKYHK